jgi:hypothetical protein
MILPDPDKCPQTIVWAFVNYRDCRVPPGGFVRAVLENDLLEAFKRADFENIEAMPHIVAWLYEKMPGSVYGDKATVAKHLAISVDE